MKQFFYSLMGTVSGIWISVGIGFILLIVAAGVMAAGNGGGKKVQVKDKTVLHMELCGSIVDRATPLSLQDRLSGEFSDIHKLNDMILSLDRGAEDDRISGLYLECNGVEAGLAQCQALHDAVVRFKKSGKWVIAYGQNYSQADYFIASPADSLFVNPVGMIDIHGLSAHFVYFKNLLDKVGVNVQVVKVGTFKSAVEPFILNEMSPANIEQNRHFLGRMWTYTRNLIANSRNVKPDSVDTWANSFSFALPQKDYVARGLADGLRYTHQIDTLLALLTDKDVDDDADLIEYTDYVDCIDAIRHKSDAPTIAVLYAMGDITESAKGGIASDDLVPQILDLAEDKNIDGLVMRVNSGGGSAFASEQIWEALEQFKKLTGKPYYVSMGDMAASGGYYISCGADSIYAQPLTLTGSIGIFGLIPEAQTLLHDKLGVSVYDVSTNYGQFPGITKPMTEAQREAMQGYVDRGYELFVQRCAKGRHTSVAAIKAVAEGRVWDGQSAKEHKLVDVLGGLDAAIADMAKRLGADPADKRSYRLEEYPEVKNKWWEELLELDESLDVTTMTPGADVHKRWSELYNRIMNTYPLQCRTDYVIVK